MVPGMRQRSVLVGGVMAAVGVVLVVISVVVLVREIARTPEWGSEPLFGVALGVVLVLVGRGAVRDRRRFPPGYRADGGSDVPFPYAPPQPEIGYPPSSYDCGGDSGGGGGDCGGGGGAS